MGRCVRNKPACSAEKIIDTIVSKENKTCSLRICDCGLVDYKPILQLQLDLCKKRKIDQIPNTVLIVEHNPVITLGARSSFNKLLVEKEQLAEKQIEVVEIRRGGGSTAHNPGQLVFYPIVDLRQLNLGVGEYVRSLEAIGIELLEQLDVSSNRRKGFPGLWVGEQKIASIGVRVKKSITFHGMAININNDLSIFDTMIPCGLDGVEMTSVEKQIGKKSDMNDVKKNLGRIIVEKWSSPEQTEYESRA